MKYTKWDIAEILKRHPDVRLFPEMDNIKESAKHECFREEVEKLRKLADAAIEEPSRILPFIAYANCKDNDEKDRLNIKATTTEKLGFEGREEGISAMAVVLIEKL